MTLTKSKPNTTRTLLWAGGVILLLAAAYGIYMLLRMGSVPADMDLSTTRLSDNGLFSVSYAASADKVPVNQMHEWTLHVETAEGQIVEDAVIQVAGDMPQHGHGLPTSPRVTQYLGGGDYRVEGLRFQMAGWWVINFTITAGGQTDTVHFNMQLQ